MIQLSVDGLQEETSYPPTFVIQKKSHNLILHDGIMKSFSFVIDQVLYIVFQLNKIISI